MTYARLKRLTSLAPLALLITVSLNARAGQSLTATVAQPTSRPGTQSAPQAATRSALQPAARRASPPLTQARKVSIDVKDADIHNVFRLLATVGGVNIVVSDRVAGRVTLRLQDVPWMEALQMVLNARGLGAAKAGSILQIDTLEAIKQRSDAMAAVRATDSLATPLKTVIFPLSYANADDLRPIVSSFLTARGSVLSDVRTNSLIVTDIPSSIEKISELVGTQGSSPASP